MKKLLEKLNHLKQYPLIIVFFATLFVFFIGGIVAPDKAVSDLENRPLTQMPAFDASFIKSDWSFSIDTFKSKYDAFATSAGNWTITFNEYAKDQLPFRDRWISMHSGFELAQGKLENGGIWYAKDGYQIAKNTSFSDSQKRTTDINTQAVCEMAERHPGKVSLMLVPSPASTLSELLHYHPPQVNEDLILDEVFLEAERAGSQIIDLRPHFIYAADTVPIFYRTDHHWTTEGGALIAYESFCETNGIKSTLPDPDTLTTAENFLGTNYAKSKKPFTTPDTLYYYDLDNRLTIYSETNDDPLTGETAPLMDKEKLDEYDKYASFIQGNNGYSEIDGNGEGSLLLIKDSYGNSFAPYLIENYKTIGVMDLRAWSNPDNIINQRDFDDILILYSFQNFCQDTNAKRMLTEMQ